jgi:hypothetical protein
MRVAPEIFQRGRLSWSMRLEAPSPNRPGEVGLLA